MSLESRTFHNGHVVGYSWYSEKLAKEYKDDPDIDGCCLRRCHECHRENHAMMDVTGQCAWCGFQETLDKMRAREGVEPFNED